MAACPTIPVSCWTPEDQLAKDQYNAEVRSQLNELTTQTETLLDRHATKLLASSAELRLAIKEQAHHLRTIKETVDRLMKGGHGGLKFFLARAGVLLKAAQESRSEDPVAQTERLRGYLEEMMSLSDDVMSLVVKDLTCDGREMGSMCPNEIAIPRNAVQVGMSMSAMVWRCREKGHREMLELSSSSFGQWYSDLKNPDSLAALQKRLRDLCDGIQRAESHTAPAWGEKALTVAPGLRPAADRQARRDAITQMGQPEPVEPHVAETLTLQERIDRAVQAAAVLQRPKQQPTVVREAPEAAALPDLFRFLRSVGTHWTRRPQEGTPV